ncbi:C-C motif chemokine 25 [Dromiciops gliroides]|uniref:C-C motif chemokine 25 n=1 Tax=Dromiciops gliroides TaxID=33562 RepID=UPI001CC78E22|nr:C-C motif chemokine 25 [Dromiciops gliroides]
MNLQLLTCLLVALIPVVSSQGTYEDCCLRYSRLRKAGILWHIRNYTIQEVNGSCNLRAVIFRLRKNNIICANPDERWVKAVIKYLPNKTYQNFLKLIKEIKKDFGGNITNTTLGHVVQAHRRHGVGRHQMRLEHI